MPEPSPESSPASLPESWAVHRGGIGRLFAGIAALLAFASPLFPTVASAQTTVSLTADRDNTLFEDAAGSLSGGSGDGVFVGKNLGETVRRALVRFDFSSIPAGSTINSAELRLFVTRTRSGAVPVSVHRVLGNWGEANSAGSSGGGGGGPASPGDATWLHRFYDTTNWATPGGDFLPAASAAYSVGVGQCAWTGNGLSSDVQHWIDNPAANFGWILIGNEVDSPTAKRFASRENSTASYRPTLIVNYTAPASIGACCLPDLSCVTVDAAQCASLGGTYRGDGVSCATANCAPQAGACCFPNASCLTLSSADCAAQGGSYRGDGTACATAGCTLQLPPFVDALPIPTIAQPTTGAPGSAAHYDIAMTEFSQQLHRDLPPTRVWGYAGTYPGPTIEARRGQPVTVIWTNDLRDQYGVLRSTHLLPVDTCLHGPDANGVEPFTVVHLHGGHVPAGSDGHPDDAFPPGQQSYVYSYPNNQPAATNWYHDHALGLTRLNVYMGLAGVYLLRDDAEDALNLPRGPHEIPLIIQDRSFNPDGSLKYASSWVEHYFGDFPVVNGKVAPFLTVKQGKYRFRVVNGSNSRAYSLALSTGATFWQIATDSGLMAAPTPLNILTLTPGERADIIVDFAPYGAGTEIILTNSAPSPFPAGGAGPDLPQIMKFIVSNQPGDTDPIPGALVPFAPIPETQAVQQRDLLIRKMPSTSCGQPEMWGINDLMWDDITEFPRVGTTEIWSWINRSGVTHPMHMHLVSFQILDRQNFTVVGDQIVPSGPRLPPAANEIGWKDTVQAPPFQITRVIAKFETYTGRFAYHCHILEHEDHEMMRQFEVLCDAPTIATHPAPAQTCPGTDAAFFVDAQGDALSFQWLRNGVALLDDARYSGTKSAVLSISQPRLSDEGVFTIRITSPCGEVVSTPAALKVCPADIDDGSGSGVCDRGVGIEDLLYYLGVYELGLPKADVDNGTFTGEPDGGVGIEDLLYYLDRYDRGC